VDLNRVTPVCYCHVIRPRRRHHPTRHRAPRADGKRRLLIPCTAKDLLRLSMTSLSRRTNSPDAVRQAVPCLRAVAGYPTARAGR
jgi:hypothetical protein